MENIQFEISSSLIRESGVELPWLADHITDVLDAIFVSNTIPVVATYTLRFLSTEAAHRTCGVNIFDSEDRGMGTNLRDVKGLSIGSRLLSRIAKFTQHLSSSLMSLSRDLDVISIATNGRISSIGGDNDIQSRRGRRSRSRSSSPTKRSMSPQKDMGTSNNTLRTGRSNTYREEGRDQHTGSPLPVDLRIMAERLCKYCQLIATTHL